MKILIAIDDDDASRAALDFARRFIGEDDDVIVLHVTGGVVPYIADPFGGFVTVSVDETVMDRIDERAEEVVESASDVLDHETEPVVEYGSPVARICELAAERNVDLIVIGSHERGAFARFVHGSVSDDVVHNAPCAVLVAKTLRSESESPAPAQ